MGFRLLSKKTIGAMIVGLLLAVNVSEAAFAEPGIISTIPVSGSTTDMVYSPDGTKIYAPIANSKTIKIIEVSTNTVVDSFTIPQVDNSLGSIEISPDGNYLYVIDYIDSQAFQSFVIKVDLATKTAMRLGTRTGGYGERVGAGAASMAISNDGTNLFVPSTVDDNVRVIATATMTANSSFGSQGVLGPWVSSVGSIRYENPRDILVTPTGNIIISFYKDQPGSGTSGLVLLLPNGSDDLDLKLSASTSDESVHARWMAISPDGRYTYVSNDSDNGWVKVFDNNNAQWANVGTITSLPSRTSGLNSPRALSVSKDGTKLYVASSSPQNRVFIYGTADLSAIPQVIEGITDSLKILSSPNTGLNFSYTTSNTNNVYQIGVGISPKSQTVSSALGQSITTTPIQAFFEGSGSISFTLSGTLPAGLSFNGATGVISGQATSTTAQTTYTITASNGSETSTSSVLLSVTGGTPTPTPSPSPSGNDPAALAQTGSKANWLPFMGSLILIACGVTMVASRRMQVKIDNKG